MVAKFDQYIRWDFLGLSTDTKPTPTTSEDVTDGSTYYEVDTSKLYVWCQDDWYEKQGTGGGGGGSTPQIKVLTAEDVNWPASNPTGIALCNLPDGIYSVGDDTPVNACEGNTARYALTKSDGGYAVVITRTNSDYKYVHIYRKDVCISCTVSMTTKSVGSYYIRPTKVEDSLTSNSTEAALSAKQGKVLNEKINVVAMPLTLNEATGVLTSQQTCAQIKALINEGKIFIPYVRLADTSLVEGGVVIITPENSGGNMVIYIFDGDSAQFVLISLTADTDSDYFTGSLPS